MKICVPSPLGENALLRSGVDLANRGGGTLYTIHYTLYSVDSLYVQYDVGKDVMAVILSVMKPNCTFELGLPEPLHPSVCHMKKPWKSAFLNSYMALCPTSGHDLNQFSYSVSDKVLGWGHHLISGGGEEFF